MLYELLNNNNNNNNNMSVNIIKIPQSNGFRMTDALIDNFMVKVPPSTRMSFGVKKVSDALCSTNILTDISSK